MSKRKVHLIVGCPGSGKSWVADKLKEKYHHIKHDDFIGQNSNGYLREILKQAKETGRPILIESPFSVRQLKEPLEQSGVPVECVFIQEAHDVIKGRYEARENKPIPPGHLTRQQTYAERAKESQSFHGTSQQCLDYLQGKDDPQSGET